MQELEAEIQTKNEHIARKDQEIESKEWRYEQGIAHKNGEIAKLSARVHHLQNEIVVRMT